ILVAGSFDSNGGKALAFWQLNLDGTYDTSFMGGGQGFLQLASSTETCYQIALLGDGRILAFGSTNGDHLLARLWQDGSLEQGGGRTYGVDEMGPGAHETAYGVVVQSDGKLIVAGTASDANYLENYALLARFLPDGEIDRTFGVDGHVIFGFGATNSARAVA